MKQLHGSYESKNIQLLERKCSGPQDGRATIHKYEYKQKEKERASLLL